MSRMKKVSEESYGLLEQMGVDIDFIIHHFHQAYSASVEKIPGKQEDDGDVVVRIGHLTITDLEMMKLEETWTTDAISEVVDALRNYTKISQYKSGYLTVKQWLTRRGDSAKKRTAIDKENASVFGSDAWKARNGL